MKKILFLFLPIILFAKMIINFPVVTTKNTPKAMAAKYFAKKVKELSNGSMIVNIQLNSKLSDAYLIGNINSSKDVQLIAPALTKFATYISKIDFFNTPFLFKNINQVHKLFDSKDKTNIINLFRKNDFILLGAWDNGFTELTSNKLILSPKDLAGCRVRVYVSKVAIKYMQAHKAIPISFPFHYLYKALEKGLIDTQINTLSNIYSKKVYKLQKYLIMLDYNYLGYGVVINKTFWEKLSRIDKDIIKRAFAMSTKYETKLAKELNEKMLKQLKEYEKNHDFKIIYLSKQLKEEFIRDSKKISNNYRYPP